MEKKLSLDTKRIDSARMYAGKIAESVQGLVDTRSTVAVERTICRLLGIDGADADGAPLANIVVDWFRESGILRYGAARLIGNACVELGLTPEGLAAKILSGETGLRKILVGESTGESTGESGLRELTPEKTKAAEKLIFSEASKTVSHILGKKRKRDAFLESYAGSDREPLLYAIVATGNIYEDIKQAEAAAKQGADVIAVIRTTAQSLLDYVPFGATTEGFGGTYATRENFRLMREALDDVSRAAGRYIRLCNYCSGLCMPEIAAIGALERLDVMLNDALYGILFRDINMERTFIDQHFSRVINGFAGIIINTGEDNYLTTSDAVEEARTVLASQFLNEQLALRAGVPGGQIGLGHAFEIDPDIENSFLLELAQALAAREIFPDAKLKYMPPTKHMTGNIFMWQVQNVLFNMVSVLTGQNIHLLGMMTEAIHTPFMSDRALAIENANYVFKAMRGLGDEMYIKPGGIIGRRAAEVLDGAEKLLGEIDSCGLFAALEKGMLAGIKRRRDGGRGLDGVFEKGEDYFNPFIELMSRPDNGRTGRQADGQTCG